MLTEQDFVWSRVLEGEIRDAHRTGFSLVVSIKGGNKRSLQNMDLFGRGYSQVKTRIPTE